MSKKLIRATALAALVGMGAGCGEQGGHSLIQVSQTSGFRVSQRVPASDDIEVDLIKPIAVTFNEDVDAASVDVTTLVVRNGGANVAGAWAYDTPTRTATFTPAGSYPTGSTITVEARSSVRQSDGHPLVPEQWSFSTLNLSDLLAYWRFDGDGTDYSGNNRTATATDIIYDAAIKKQGTTSARFNGLSSFFDLGVFNLGDAFTIMAWVYMPTPLLTGINTVISNGAGGVNQNGFKLFINQYMTANRAIATEAGDGSVGTLLVTTPDFVTTGAWKHLAVVINKNATDPNKRALFYFNGALTTQSLGPGSSLPAFPNVFGTNRQTYIGKFPGDLHWFSGRMDDFRIYTGTVAPARILRISQQQ